MKYLCLLFILFAINANAQPLFKEKYKDCTLEKPCYYCGDAIASYKKGLSERLQRSINNGQHKWVGTNGNMYFEIEVDSTGHSCVRSIKDEIPMWDVKNVLTTSINNLYDWQPAILDGHPINSTLILRIHFLGYRASFTFLPPDDPSILRH